MHNVALIGCGYWGSKLKRYIKLNPFFNLTYVCNSKTDLSEIWKNKSINTVVVATPNESHYRIVKEGLQSGKNVLSEKPLALSGEEAEELQKLSAGKKQVLVCEYTYTFSPGLQRVKQIVDNKVLGKIRSFQLSMKRFGRFGRGHVCWLLGSHMLSVLDMFCSIENFEYEKVNLLPSDGSETNCILCHNNSQDQTGIISVSLNYPGKETRVILYGDQGSVEYNELNHPTIVVRKYEKTKNLIENLDFDESNNLQHSIEYFANVLQEKQVGNIDRAVKVSSILKGKIL